ncbi:MAG: hypothetical protein JXA50_01570 [Deltaproteobacteria bacterium]|nr:hypothetical protein [Deltaproteobacteria bacterium]
MTTREIINILRNDPKLADKVLDGVPTLQALVIRRKFGIQRPITNRELANELGVTPSNISFLIKSGLNKIIRNPQRIKLIASYIESEGQKRPRVASNQGG